MTGKWLQENPEITKGLFICQHQKTGLAILTTLKSLWEDFYDIRPPGANAGDGGRLVMTGLHGLVLLHLIFIGAWARPSPCERKKKGKHVMASECHSGSCLLQAYLHGNQGWQLYGIH